ncbi:helix-turn-helix transcriptional regulator [Actinacidiphila yeochonensis]|uniref:helix-turn-helix transcriptional regulator n=1 Tax=Actinacidiphila yeochonensis TaxID=89050 RepID=UPI00055F43D1|nr:helix-turn-helix transcriptional regulator [Actinacidiphila yeochonensis]
MKDAVHRAIETMWKHYGEPVSLSDLADAAILSRFYFSRVFRQVTGTSPGRFLSAVRLHQAKELLRESELSVTEISYEVGYNSPGTFTSRFTRSVGLSPTRYRDHARLADFCSLPQPPGPDPRHGTFVGTVLRSGVVPLRTVYVGAFSSSVPEGRPVAWDVLGPERQRFQLHGVPDGAWHIRVAGLDGSPPEFGTERRMLVGTCPAVTAQSGRVVKLDITLRPSSVFDLPMLFALPELDCRDQRLLADAC